MSLVVANDRANRNFSGKRNQGNKTKQQTLLEGPKILPRRLGLKARTQVSKMPD